MKFLKVSIFSTCMLLGSTSLTLAESFDAFLDGVRTELQAKKIDVSIFNKAMVGVEAPNKKVHKKLKTQPESIYTFSSYLLNKKPYYEKTITHISIYILYPNRIFSNNIYSNLYL